MWTQLRKYAAGDIVPSLTSLKKHEPKLKFFVSISENSIKLKFKVEQSGNLRNLWDFFYYFSYVRNYKATLADGNKKSIRSISSDGKEDGWSLWDGIKLSLRKQLCTFNQIDEVLTFNQID